MLKSLLVGSLESSKSQLLATFNAVPDDKLTWKPLDQGRSAMECIGDAAQTPKLALQLIQMAPGTPIPPMREAFAQMTQERGSWSKADALQHLETNHAALVAAIQNMSDEELGRMLSIPMRPDFEMTLPIAGWTMMANRSYISRFAQINYIQTLYGDMEGH